MQLPHMHCLPRIHAQLLASRWSGCMQARQSLLQLLRLLCAVFQLDQKVQPDGLDSLYGSWLHVVVGFGQRCPAPLAPAWSQALQQVCSAVEAVSGRQGIALRSTASVQPACSQHPVACSSRRA